MRVELTDQGTVEIDLLDWRGDTAYTITVDEARRLASWINDMVNTAQYCPLVRENCVGIDCAWWIEGEGVPGRCAITQIARHHVIASQFEPDVGNALQQAALQAPFLQVGNLAINPDHIREMIFEDNGDVVIFHIDGHRNRLIGDAAADFKGWWYRIGGRINDQG
jgi:hypothetical protein